MAGESTLTHLSPQGGVRMVDVSGKTVSIRTAVAAGRVLLGDEAFNLVKENRTALSFLELPNPS